MQILMDLPIPKHAFWGLKYWHRAWIADATNFSMVHWVTAHTYLHVTCIDKCSQTQQWVNNHLLHSVMDKFLKLLFSIWRSSFIIRNIQVMVCLICWETCLCYQRTQIQSDVQTLPGIRRSCYVLMCYCMLSLFICMLTSFSAFAQLSWVSQNVSLEGMTGLFQMLSMFVVSVLPSKVNRIISIAPGCE